MTIGQIERQPALFVKHDASVARVCETIDRAGCDGAIIEGAGGAIGVVTFADLSALLKHRASDSNGLVGEYGLVCPFETSPESNVAATLRLMRRYGVGLIPITEDGQVTSMATVAALQKALRDDFRSQKREQRRIAVAGASVFAKTVRRRKV